MAKGFPQDAKVFAFYSMSGEELGDASSSICNMFRFFFYPLIARRGRDGVGGTQSFSEEGNGW